MFGMFTLTAGAATVYFSRNFGPIARLFLPVGWLQTY